MTLDDIRDRLDQISKEMTALIRKHNLSAASPLQVISHAKSRITDPVDYTRFLELSLEGRILVEEGDRLMKAQGNLH